jgi:hypothetical protein
MKAIKKTQMAFIGLVTLAALTLNACKKDVDLTAKPATTVVEEKGVLAFHIHSLVDSVEIEAYDTVYKLSDGRKFSVTMAQLYLSNIQLIKLDGSTVDVLGVIKLKQQQVEECELGSVPVGNYKSIKFKVGLSAAVNSAIPTNTDTTLNQPDMWFNAAMAQPDGFVFVNFEGAMDTTVAANGSVLIPFSYKIGTNANLQTVTFPDQNFIILKNQTQEIHMGIDYAKLFDGIQLNNNGNLTMNTVSANATALGIMIANNIQKIFSYM